MKNALKKIRFFNMFYVLIVALSEKFYIQNLHELKEELADLIKAIPSIRGKIGITEENIIKFRQVMLLISEMGGLDVLLELLTELKQAKILGQARDIGDVFLDHPDWDELLNKEQQKNIIPESPEKKMTNPIYPRKE